MLLSFRSVFAGYGTIIIDYSFASGIQGIEHPNPFQYYGGTNRRAYLPDTREGQEVLQLLKRVLIRCSVGVYRRYLNYIWASKSNNVERYPSQD